MQRLWIFIIISLFPYILIGQKVKAELLPLDSMQFIPLISVNYSATWPVGDMNVRYGFTNVLGLDIDFKTKNNWIFGAEGGFMFGKKINEPSIAYALYDDNGLIWNTGGAPALVFFMERGFYGDLVFGKVFPIFGPTKNAGLMVKLGIGYWHHKIRIESNDDYVPQVEGDYIKGYDRFCMGWNVKPFIGYLHIGRRRLLNFYTGIEAIIGSTKNIRTMNFDTGLKDHKARFDMLVGFKFGWIVPIRTRTKDAYFLN